MHEVVEDYMTLILRLCLRLLCKWASQIMETI